MVLMQEQQLHGGTITVLHCYHCSYILGKIKREAHICASKTIDWSNPNFWNNTPLAVIQFVMFGEKKNCAYDPKISHNEGESMQTCAKTITSYCRHLVAVIANKTFTTE